MSIQHADQVMTDNADAVRRVLLDPLALPDWNPAFLSVDGPERATLGTEYRIRVRPGLTGTLTYTSVDADRIDITWQVPAFRETSSWTLRALPAGTLVGHEFEHAGALAAVLEGAYQGVARLRLQRLDERLRDARRH